MIQTDEGARYPYPLQAVYAATIAAVGGLKGMKVAHDDPVTNRIEIAKGVSATSWGDRVLVSLMEVPGGTQVFTSSAPKTGIALGGWMSGGRQSKNVSQLFSAISDQLRQVRAAADGTQGGQITMEQKPESWTAAPASPTQPVAQGPARKTSDERKELLARMVTNQIAQGARVESQSDYQAILVRGHRTNHVLHLILTLVTLGLWVLVWVPMAIFGGEKRSVASVDEWGNVTLQKV